MKECQTCHKQFENHLVFCPDCGNVLTAQQTIETPINSSVIKYGEFARKLIEKPLKNSVTACFIALLVIAGINVIVSLVNSTFSSILLDLIVVIGVAFWWKYTVSIPSVVVTSVYALINCIYMTSVSGQLAGYWHIFVAIAEIITLIKVKKAYKSFIAG